MRVKLGALVVSALITGLVGGLWYYFIGAVHPQSAFDPLFDLQLALMGFFGGLGTVFGPALGALILEPVQQWLTVQFTNDYLSEILLGAVFLLVILFLPRGVIPTLGERITAWRSRARDRSVSETTADGGAAPEAAPPDLTAPGTSAGAPASRTAGRREGTPS
jgi:branched-chain amino acid transport system permease protein